MYYLKVLFQLDTDILEYFQCQTTTNLTRDCSASFPHIHNDEIISINNRNGADRWWRDDNIWDPLDHKIGETMKVPIVIAYASGG